MMASLFFLPGKLLLVILVAAAALGFLALYVHVRGPALTNGHTSSVGPAPASTTALIAQVQPSAGALPSTAVSRSVSPLSTANGLVSLNFDDGYESMYQYALPILDAAGIKSTQYIITGKIGQSGYVTVAQVLHMYREGHEIGAHTRTHPHLSRLTPQVAAEEIDGSRDDLRAMGIDPMTFAYPYGDFSTTTAALVRAAGFAAARTTRPGFDAAGTDPFFLLREPVDATTTLQEVQQWISTARTDHAWLILVFHRFDDPGNPISISHQLLQQIVASIIAAKMPVVTNEQGVRMMHIQA